MPGEPDFFIEINDFSPGIFSDFHATDNTISDTTHNSDLRGALPAANGAATIENTYDCHADRLGALIPLPKGTAGQQQQVLPGGNANAGNTSFMPSGMGASYLLDANSVGESWDGQTSNGGDRIYTIWFHRYAPAGDGVYREFIQGRQYRNYTSNAIYDFIWARILQSWANHVQLPAASIAIARLQGADMGGGIIRYNVGFVACVAPYGSFGITAITWSAGAIPANEMALLTNFQSDGLGGGTIDYTDGRTENSIGISGEHPSATLWGGTNRQVNFISGGLNMNRANYLTLIHQARAIYAGLGWSTFDDPLGAGSTFSINNAAGPQVKSIQDSVNYTYIAGADPGALNNLGVTAFPIAQLIIGFDAVSPYGAMASVASDQLFIVKWRGGATLVSGDLDNPTVRPMPYVESTHGVTAHGVNTPIGFVYGARSGVWTWAGGDTAKKLSVQLDGFFWNHNRDAFIAGRDSYMATRGRFAYWNEFVCVPNNYLLDTRNNSWWRISGVMNSLNIPYNIYNVVTGGLVATGAAGQRLYAFPYKLTPTQNTVYFYYDQEVLSDTYSWQSQPLIETRGRTQSLQEIRALVTHKGTSTATITVTITGLDANGVVLASRVVTLSAAPSAGTGRPQLLRKALEPNFTAEYVQIRIEANSGNTAQQAPKIHSVKLGVKDRARTRRVG